MGWGNQYVLEASFPAYHREEEEKRRRHSASRILAAHPPRMRAISLFTKSARGSSPEVAEVGEGAAEEGETP